MNLTNGKLSGALVTFNHAFVDICTMCKVFGHFFVAILIIMQQHALSFQYPHST